MGQETLFDFKDINSSVGNLIQGDPGLDTITDIYLNYPEVDQLISKAKSILSSGKEISFSTQNIIRNHNLDDNAFLSSSELGASTNLNDGLSTTLFNSLLTPHVAGQIVLGNFTMGYIEAKASQILHKTLHGDTSVDHFYCAEGICSLSTLEEVVRAHDFKKNEVVVLLIPSNAIKAFRRTRFSSWQLVEFESREASVANSKAYLFNKQYKKIADINLVEHHAANLDLPIYKLKLPERTVIVVPYDTSFQTLQTPLKLNISQEKISSLQSNLKASPDTIQDTEIIYASVGQAARVIFNLLGADYDLLPEVMLNLEGGSHAAISSEKSSTGRHYGTNSMNEVIKNGWHRHPELALPWNYLGFDKVTDTNKYLLEDDNNYLLSFDPYEDRLPNEKLYFIEAPQAWKKTSLDLIQYLSKFIYREYFNIASKKYLLSAKEAMSIAAKHLAARALLKLKPDSHIEVSVQEDLQEFLDTIYNLHLLINSAGEFYSSKTHPLSVRRLQCLAQIDKRLAVFCPASVQSFRQRIKEILSKDTNSEFVLLYDLYLSELNKIK